MALAYREGIFLFEIFKSKIKVFDHEVQVAAVKRLPRIAYALGEEATREELIPYLKEYLNKIYCFDEVQLHFTIALADVFPYLGGTEHVELLFDLFDVLASTDETSVREAAVDSLRKIAEQLDDITLSGPFIDFMMMLLEKEWFAPKSSAIALFSSCYPRVPEETKNIMREQYLKLYEDESPMVKKTAVLNLANFSRVLEEQYVETVSLGLLIQFASDDQDTVKTHCVDLIVAISKLLREELIRDHIIDIIHKLSADLFWKVRQEVARKIDAIQIAIGSTLTKEYLITIVRILSDDEEQLVREALSENLIAFIENLQKSNKSEILDPIIEHDLMPVVKSLYNDSSELVSSKISSAVMDLTSILDQEKIKKHLLPLIMKPERECIDESFINNLNKLILTIGLADIDYSVQQIMFRILATPEKNWRTRRNLVITIKIILARSEVNTFTKTVIPFYQKLLSDHIFSIRRTTPLILPMMIRKFGMTWAKSHLLNNIFCFTGHPNYLYRFIVLFCIDEIIEPTLQIDKKAHLSNVDSPKKLFKIYYLIEILDMLLYESWIEDLIQNHDEKLSDDIQLYAEDTLDYLKSENLDVFSKPLDEHGEDYLESILHLIVKYILEIIKELSSDKVENIRNRSAHTIKKIFTLKTDLQDDFNEIEDIINDIDEDMRDICRLEVHAVLSADEAYMQIENMHMDRSKPLRKKTPPIQHVTDLSEHPEKVEEENIKNHDGDLIDDNKEDSELLTKEDSILV